MMKIYGLEDKNEIPTHMSRLAEPELALNTCTGKADQDSWTLGLKAVTALEQRNSWLSPGALTIPHWKGPGRGPWQKGSGGKSLSLPCSLRLFYLFDFTPG